MLLVGGRAAPSPSASSEVCPTPGLVPSRSLEPFLYQKGEGETPEQASEGNKAGGSAGRQILLGVAEGFGRV